MTFLCKEQVEKSWIIEMSFWPNPNPPLCWWWSMCFTGTGCNCAIKHVATMQKLVALAGKLALSCWHHCKQESSLWAAKGQWESRGRARGGWIGLRKVGRINGSSACHIHGQIRKCEAIWTCANDLAGAGPRCPTAAVRHQPLRSMVDKMQS